MTKIGRTTMATTIVNLRRKRGQLRPVYDVKIDRSTVFGNPFEIGRDGDRNQVVEKYKEYFYKRIQTDLLFKQKVLELKGLTLACWCAPLLCHGMVIAEYLEAN